MKIFNFFFLIVSILHLQILGNSCLTGYSSCCANVFATFICSNKTVSHVLTDSSMKKYARLDASGNCYDCGGDWPSHTCNNLGKQMPTFTHLHYKADDNTNIAEVNDPNDQTDICSGKKSVADPKKCK